MLEVTASHVTRNDSREEPNMAGKEVTKTDEKGTEVAVSTGFDYGEYSHAGFEGTTINDLAIPFVNVLQPMSPEVVEGTVEDARAGDLLNSVTKEIIKQPLIVIPVFKEVSVVEWVPRSKGGGLVDRHDPDGEIYTKVIKDNGGSRIPPKDADGKRIAFKSPSGNDLVETYYVYCLIMDETGTESEGYCVLSFTSTKIKVHKNWMTSMYTIKGRPPIFANRCKISTVREIRDSGTSFNYKIGPMNATWKDSLIPPNTDQGMALLKEAKEFGDMIEQGLARADFESISDSGPDIEGQGGDTKASNDGDGEIPF